MLPFVRQIERGRGRMVTRVRPKNVTALAVDVPRGRYAFERHQSFALNKASTQGPPRPLSPMLLDIGDG